MIAAITGAASGIGQAVAHRLSEHEWDLLLIDRDGTALEQAAAVCGGRCELAVVDVADFEALSGFGRELSNRGTGLDLLFVNAGIALPDTFSQPDRETWRHTLDVNLTGAYNTICVFQGAVGAGNGHGAIVLTSSVLALDGSRSMVSYSASKAGVGALVRALAQECAARGVTVNGIAPGPVRTPILGTIGGDDIERLAGLVPLGRIGTPDDVAGAVEFLASDDASFITGQILALDGGLTSRAYWRP